MVKKKSMRDVMIRKGRQNKEKGKENGKIRKMNNRSQEANSNFALPSLSERKLVQTNNGILNNLNEY